MRITGIFRPIPRKNYYYYRPLLTLTPLMG
jgi:hypothetical protein